MTCPGTGCNQADLGGGAGQQRTSSLWPLAISCVSDARDHNLGPWWLGHHWGGSSLDRGILDGAASLGALHWGTLGCP